jgi:hypothetical protein
MASGQVLGWNQIEPMCVPARIVMRWYRRRSSHFASNNQRVKQGTCHLKSRLLHQGSAAAREHRRKRRLHHAGLVFRIDLAEKFNTRLVRLALKIGSKCSRTTCSLRFRTDFRLA